MAQGYQFSWDFYKGAYQNAGMRKDYVALILLLELLHPKIVKGKWVTRALEDNAMGFSYRRVV